MTAQEQAAFTAGIRHAADMALIAALAIEIRPDTRHLRQASAIAALRGLAEALKEQAAEFHDLLVKSVCAPFMGGFLRLSEPDEACPQKAHSPQPVASRETALAAGYTGDPCPTCHAFTMKRSGTCAVCETCHATTGCS